MVPGNRMLEEREEGQHQGLCHHSKQPLAALPEAEINAKEQMEKSPERCTHKEWSHLTSAALNTPISPSPQAQGARG